MHAANILERRPLLAYRSVNKSADLASACERGVYLRCLLVLVLMLVLVLVLVLVPVLSPRMSM